MLGLPAHAYFLNGNDLVSKMTEFEKANRSDPDTLYMYAGEYCGYIIGILDILSVSGTICMEGVTRGQAGAVVAKYLKDNPSRWNEPASVLVIDALKTAFPCKK